MAKTTEISQWMTSQMRLDSGFGMALRWMTFTLLFLPGLVFAQKGKVLSAYSYEQAFYESHDCRELAKAIEAIEMALTHEQSSVWAKTWYYRGNIYFDVYISQDDECHGLSIEALDISYESYLKSMEYDEKERYVKEIEPKISVIANLYLQRGAKYFNVKNYEAALADFEKTIEVSRHFEKTDSIALYNAALSAEKLGNDSKSALYYEGLIDIGYNDPRIYHFLSETNLRMGDTTKSFQAITAGRKVYPNNPDLIIDELNYYLQKNETEKALKNLDDAISEMPSNAQLHYARGTLLDKMGDLERAKTAYEISLKLDPDHFGANYNLGALYFNKGVEQVGFANDFDESHNKEFKAAEQKALEYFKESLPYLEKANELDPHDRATMISLKNLYSRLGDNQGYKRISELLDN